RYRAGHGASAGSAGGPRHCQANSQGRCQAPRLRYQALGRLNWPAACLPFRKETADSPSGGYSTREETTRWQCLRVSADQDPWPSEPRATSVNRTVRRYDPLPRRAAVIRRGTSAPLQLRAGRQRRLAHQVGVHAARGLAALPDRPYHQRLSSPRVTAREHAGHGGLIIGARLQVPALGQLAAELRHDRVALRAEEAEREQDELAVELELAAGDRLHDRPPIVLHPVETHAVQLPDVPLGVAAEVGGFDAPVAGHALLVRRRGAQDHRPVGPGELRTVDRRLRQELELVHRCGAMAVRGAEAVRAGVAAAEDDDALVGGEDLPRDGIARAHLVLLRQELHGEVDALQLAARYRQVARSGRAGRQHDGVELAAQVLARDVHAHAHAGAEGDALRRHLLHAEFDQPLIP